MKQKGSRKKKRGFPSEQSLVARFMGLPSGSVEYPARPPKSMHDLVDKVWEDWGIGEDETPETIISGNWQKIVGIKFAGKCAPVSLSKDGQTLQIKAASSTIKQEISFQKKSILSKINSLDNCSEINTLRIY